MTAIWRNDGTGWHTLAPQGFPDEAALHTLVEQAPQMLPLAGAPRLTVVGREVLLGNGYADLIAVEPSGRVAIIEIKLAKNSEARRAVVAQVLAYAAYLHGATPSDFERNILGNHLQKHGYTSLAQAIAAEDQEGAFDTAAFTEGLTRSLADGTFRLVIVLDTVPSELVRLVTFLESAADRLVVDLVAVSAYEVNGSTLLVPQRIEGEPDKPVAPTQSTSAKAAQGKLVDGAEDFVASIEQAQERHHAALKVLADWAVTLEQQGLAHLSTFHGVSGRLTLLPRLLVGNVGLVTIYNDNGAYLQFWRTVFENRAPESIAPVEQILGKSIGQGNSTSAITPELLSALTQAYQQAGSKIPKCSEE